MDDTIDMSPEASPNRPHEKSGVRRVNNLPIYLIGGVIMSFLVMMVLVAADRAKQQNSPAGLPQQKAVSTANFADELAGQAKDGLVQAAKPPTAIANEPAPNPVQMPHQPIDVLQAPPIPPNLPQSPTANGDQDPRVRVQMEKMHMMEEAIRARSSVSAIAPRSAASAPASPIKSNAQLTSAAPGRRSANDRSESANVEADPTAAFQDRLQQLRQVGILPTANTPATGQELSSNPSNPSNPSNGMSPGRSYSQFDGRAQEDRWNSDTQIQAPRTPYELRAGFVLPAILVSGINSDLPGQIIGQVSQDVYDTATGKWRLIPRGSRLVGQYSSDVAYGQARVLVAWQRIIFPDGKALDIGAMPGADGAGYAGFNDKVNNHYLRVFGSALLMSGVTAGIALSQPDELYGTRMSARSAMSEALGQQLGHVTAQMIARNMGIAPTLEIRPGYRFNVVVTKDLTFSKPYQAFDY